MESETCYNSFLGKGGKKCNSVLFIAILVLTSGVFNSLTAFSSPAAFLRCVTLISTCLVITIILKSTILTVIMIMKLFVVTNHIQCIQFFRRTLRTHSFNSFAFVLQVI